jgi:hypothetical protein
MSDTAVLIIPAPDTPPTMKDDTEATTKASPAHDGKAGTPKK